MQQNITTTPFPAPPAPPDAARERLREMFRGFEYWIVVADETGQRAVEQIVARCRSCAEGDSYQFTATMNGSPFTIVALRKKLMFGHQLRQELRKCRIEADIGAHDLLIIAAKQRLDLTTKFANHMLCRGDADTGMGARINLPAFSTRTRGEQMRFETRLSKIEEAQRAQLDAERDEVNAEWFALIPDDELHEMRTQECADLAGLTDDELAALKVVERRRESIADKIAALRETREDIAQRQAELMTAEGTR